MRALMLGNRRTALMNWSAALPAERSNALDEVSSRESLAHYLRFTVLSSTTVPFESKLAMTS